MFENLLEKIDECLPEDSEGNFITENEKSDVVHDILAFLAEQMIEMNKEKQKLQKEFKDWLENFIQVKIDELTNKTKLKKFDDFDWDIVRQVLLENNSKLGKNMTLENIQNEIRTKFTEAMKELEPLKKKIQATDDLIDQIVYKLYGLTHEEIGIVEQSVGGKK